jgi:hypothetical protein
MRGLVLAAMVAATATPGAASAADELPYGPALSFVAYRNGQEIGRHTLTFVQHGSEVIVSISIDFTVKALGLVTYRYTHRSTEVWNGNKFMSLSSQTDDNGKHYKVNIKRNAVAFDVERFAELEVTQASAAFEGFRPAATVVWEVAPAQALPSTQWNVRQVEQRILLNPQYGTTAHIEVVPLGRETIRTATGSLQATHYRYSGDIRMDQWFDDRGRWVKGAFVAFDGSKIDYVLQE